MMSFDEASKIDGDCKRAETKQRCMNSQMGNLTKNKLVAKQKRYKEILREKEYTLLHLQSKLSCSAIGENEKHEKILEIYDYLEEPIIKKPRVEISLTETIEEKKQYADSKNLVFLLDMLKKIKHYRKMANACGRHEKVKFNALKLEFEVLKNDYEKRSTY